ncbi:MAG TPA: hypothetical protein VH682_30540 [Gemmataceae bacterium]|jgi:hypothetical protein
MISTFADPLWSRARRLGLGLLLLALPACGLSEYEGLMREKAQKNEEHFRNEQKYLDEPVQIPMQKNKEGKDVPLANVFFRPPKGIRTKPDSGPRDDLLWRYPAVPKSGGDFTYIEMAFATDDKTFRDNVLNNYRAEESFPTPQRDPPLPFDTWEFNDSQHGYSINISKGGRTQVAVVYVFGKGRRDALRMAMDLSLQSLAIDGQAVNARQKYSQKSPWQLKPTPAP